jgi:hypothetical protein
MLVSLFRHLNLSFSVRELRSSAYCLGVNSNDILESVKFILRALPRVSVLTVLLLAINILALMELPCVVVRDNVG